MTSNQQGTQAICLNTEVAASSIELLRFCDDDGKPFFLCSGFLNVFIQWRFCKGIRYINYILTFRWS